MTCEAQDWDMTYSFTAARTKRSVELERSLSVAPSFMTD